MPVKPISFVAALVLAALPLVAAPAPSPAPTEKPLKEIGRVRATTPLCRSMLEHATVAVNVVLDNDAKIAQTEATLRSVDLDSSAIAKFQGTKQITREYVALRRASVDGIGTAKQLREEAQNAPTDEQKHALTSFADALAGAIYRQKKMAEDMGRFIAYLDSQEPLTEEERDEMRVQLLEHASDRTIGHNPFGDLNSLPETLSKQAKEAADQWHVRTLPIADDEDTAAKRIEPAFAGC